MDPQKAYSNWAEIDLQALASNVSYLVKTTGVQVMAVVKANAYGHGAVPCARAALRGGATWLAVARLEEALELRRAGIESPILLLGYTPLDRFDETIASRISLTVWEAEQIQIASQAANRVGQTALLHLKIDTGMSRLGVQPEGALPLARQIATSQGALLEGIFTHFARADEADPASASAQEIQFREIIESLKTLGISPHLVHAANSAAGLTRSSAFFNLIRAGISIYGLHPSAECLLPQDFRPVLSWKAILSQVKTLPAGRGVSYGHIYVTKREERIGTIPVGYADGFRRTGGNMVIVGGQRCPVVGRVCMDQIMVQLDGVAEAKAGDEVVLIGRQGDQTLTAEEIGDCWGTINYEVTCGIAARVPRLYF
jgi:alanine racemase